MGISNLYRHGDREGEGQDLRADVTRIAAGDSEALASLYDRTQRLVYSLARRIVGQPEEAEEVTLDVYAQVWRDAARYKPDRGSVEGWLVTITRSRAIDQRRVRAARPDMGGGTHYYLRDLSRMDAAIYAWEPRQRVMKLLKVLAPRERQLITLAFFEGYTHRELSNLLGLPLGTVKTRIRLSLLRMRQAQVEDKSKRLARGHDSGELPICSLPGAAGVLRRDSRSISRAS